MVVEAPAPGMHHAPQQIAVQIISIGRRTSRHQYDLCRLLAEYDLSGHWALTGAVTCSRWAADMLEVETGTAREWLRVGHALRELTEIGEAFADGRLSYAKVRTLTRVAVDHPDRQEELISLAATCTASALSRELARWSAAEEDDGERDRRHRREMFLSARTEPDGAHLITARLPPLDGAKVMAVIDRMATQSGSRPTADRSSALNVGSGRATTARPTLAQRRAAALVELATEGGAGVTAELLIHLRDDGATLTDGTPVAGHLVERLAPQSFFRALIHDAERRPINASGRQRHPTVRQQRVVAERDGYQCTAEGCTATEFLELDHVPEFARSRRTVVDELFLRCSKHHRDRHEGPPAPG